MDFSVYPGIYNTSLDEVDNESSDAVSSQKMTLHHCLCFVMFQINWVTVTQKSRSHPSNPDKVMRQLEGKYLYDLVEFG